MRKQRLCIGFGREHRTLVAQAVGATGEVIDGRLQATEFLNGLLSYCQQHNIPMDFFNGGNNPFDLFNRYGVPRKNYYAMAAFNELLATPERVQASGWQAGRTAVCAGIDSKNSRAGVLISNLRDANSSFTLEIEHLPWDGPTAWTFCVLDAKRDLQPIESGVDAAGKVTLSHDLPAPSVGLIQLRPASKDEAAKAASSNEAAPLPTAESTPTTTGARTSLLSLRDIRVTSPFWSARLQVYRQRTIRHSWQYMDWELRALKHAAGEPVNGDLNGTWGEANLHKFLETCAYCLAQLPDPSLQQQTDDVIRLLGRVQQPDGYLHAYITNNDKPPWDPKFLDGSHDGYVLGHMIEAAIEYHAATGDDAFLRIARRTADQACEHFLSPNGQPGFCGHAELEMALVELYRVTDEVRYLELARAFVEWRGHGKVKPFSETPRAYFQDAVPLRQQKTLEGHAVRAIFFATGVADLALETGDCDYRLAAQRFWDSTAGRRMTTTYYQNPLSDANRPCDNWWVCCPPNLSRTLMQIGRYALLYDDQGVDVNLFVDGEYTFSLPDATVHFRMETDYPWDGGVRIEFLSVPHKAWTLSLRMPGWCRRATWSVNSEPVTAVVANENGYLQLRRTWQAGDSVELNLDMQPQWIEAHPNVRSCEGRIALERGPLIYAFEGLDNGGNLNFALGSDPPLSVEHRPDLLGGVTVIQTQAADGRPLLAIPFYALANRDPSVQQVWIAQPDASRRTDWWRGELYRPTYP